MLLCGEYTLSFLSCLSNSHRAQQKVLLGTADIARSPQQAASPPFLHRVQCNNNPHNLTPQVSKTVFRLQKQGIQVTPKIFHRVKKKEAWKAVRRERKEKDKADRVPDPVWYDWPEELGVHEMRKLSIAQTEEECADEFLFLLEEARPTRQIGIGGIDNAGLSVSKGAASASMQRRTVNVQKQRKVRRKRSSGDGSASPILSVAQVWRSSSTVREEDALSLHENTSEFCLPWAGKPVVEDNGGVHELERGRLNPIRMSNKRELTDGLNLDEHFGESKQSNIVCTKPVADEELREPLNLDKQDLHVYTEGSNYASRCYMRGSPRYNVVDERPPIHAPTLSNKVEPSPTASTGTLSSSIDTALTVTNIDQNYLPPRKEPHLSKDFDTKQIEKFLDNEANKEPQLIKKLHTAQRGKFLDDEADEEPHPRKELDIAQIERFLDDGIRELPEGQDTWIKGVGLVETIHQDFSEEITDRIIDQRQGDWSASHEEGAVENESNSPSMILFNVQAALLEDRRIQRLATKLQDVNYWLSKVHFSKTMHSGKMKLTEDRVIRVIQILGEKGNWRRAMQVVQWVHKRQRYLFRTSKYDCSLLHMQCV